MDCSSGSCVETISYTGFGENDAAVIVEKSDCSGVQPGNVKSGPVQISGTTNNIYDFTTVEGFADPNTDGSLCWCYNCYTSNTTDFSQYKTKIGEVNGPAVPSSVIPSRAIIGRLSSSLMILLALTILNL
eukprot:GHVL01026392.1.p1 GENE.GHVL01026392.1~~GHVL01026392.1.p1  ORF type:complete len:130 (+),score=15.63 GHVL01026392.1:275-664(+)